MYVVENAAVTDDHCGTFLTFKSSNDKRETESLNPSSGRFGIMIPSLIKNQPGVIDAWGTGV